MKNKELYESIEKLVKEGGKESKTHLSQAQEYCQREIKKKKLTPRTELMKIAELLENFKKTQTYVNVSDLMQCVEETYRLQENKKNETPNLSKTPVKPMTQRFASENFDSKVLTRANSALKKHHRRQYTIENDKIDQFVRYFESNSNFRSESVKNSHDLLISPSKDSESNQNNKENEMCHEWNYYSYINNATKTEANENNSSEVYYSLQKQKKKLKMFELAQIYLQMILENEYKKKWNQKFREKISNYEFEPKENIMKILERRRESSNQNCSNNEYAHQKRGSLLSSSSNHLRRESESSMNNLLANGCNLEKRKTKRSSKNRDIAIRKVSNFIVDLEEDEVEMRNEKKTNLRRLSKLEKQIGDDSCLFRDGRIWKDEEKCLEIQKVLNRYSGVKSKV